MSENPAAQGPAVNPTTDWLGDVNGNRCSISWFGSREAAQAALYSLKNCENCINCLRCSDCSDCSACSDCSRCSDCSACSGCSGCSDCSDCSDCSHIANLYNRENLYADPGRVGQAAGAPPIPHIEKIHERVLEAAIQPGALDMSKWHTCGTTHCRAGWVVHLAGEAGYALEQFHDTALAAQLIYRESNPLLPVSPVRFYDSNIDALADMQRMAAAERVA